MDSDPTEPVAKALAAYQRAERRLDETRDVLHAAIVTADGQGVKQAVLVRLTGYSRERIRQIVKAAKEADGG